MAVVVISREFSSNEFTCHNIITSSVFKLEASPLTRNLDDHRVRKIFLYTVGIAALYEGYLRLTRLAQV
jgi:hypothetical protein